MAAGRYDSAAILSARIDAATLAAFDAYAEGRGGRSAVLRRLIREALDAEGQAARLPPPASATPARISLRLSAADHAALDRRAAERGTTRSGWIKALVRRHIALKPRVDDALLDQLAPIRMQLLRIGRNLNQAAKAANSALPGGGGDRLADELARIADMRSEIAAQVDAVGSAMRADASYWSVPD